MIFYKPWDNTNQSSSRYILSTGEVNRWMCWPTATYNPFLLVDRSKYLLRYSPFVILSLCLQKCRAPSSSYIDRPDLARNSDPPVDHRRNRTRTPHPPSSSVISTHRKEGVINVRVNNETSCKYFANKWRLAFNWFAVKFKKSMTLEQFSWRWFKRNAIICGDNRTWSMLKRHRGIRHQQQQSMHWRQVGRDHIVYRWTNWWWLQFIYCCCCYWIDCWPTKDRWIDRLSHGQSEPRGCSTA